MEIYSRYNPPKVSGLKCPEHSLTEQVYKDQCDLNFLIHKYGLDEDPFALQMYIDPNSRKMQFVDTTQVPDLYAALVAQKKLRQFFNELDYSQQEKFNFSLDAFSEYLMSASEDDIKKLGLKNLQFADLPPLPKSPIEAVSAEPQKPESDKAE